MSVFTTFIYIIFIMYKQGRAGTWPPIQSLPAHNFAFSGWAEKALIVNKTFRHLVYLYKFVICYMPCYMLGTVKLYYFHEFMNMLYLSSFFHHVICFVRFVGRVPNKRFI